MLVVLCSSCWIAYLKQNCASSWIKFDCRVIPFQILCKCKCMMCNLPNSFKKLRFGTLFWKLEIASLASSSSVRSAYKFSWVERSGSFLFGDWVGIQDSGVALGQTETKIGIFL